MKGGSECTKRVENRTLYVYRTGYDLRVATQAKSAKPAHFLRGDNSFPTRIRGASGHAQKSRCPHGPPERTRRISLPPTPFNYSQQKKPGEIRIFCSSFRTSFAQVPIKNETKLASMPRTTSPVFLENVSHPRVFHESRWFTRSEILMPSGSALRWSSQNILTNHFVKF